MANENGGSGGCLCGGVRYKVDGRLSDVGACHCSQCRKTTGHYFAAATCKRDALTFETDETLAWYESSARARRGFCSRCGSTLFWEANDRDEIDILAGTLDQPTGLKLRNHIFVADKGDYYELTDGLPQHAQYPESRRSD
jgi:hypothetical protein